MFNIIIDFFLGFFLVLSFKLNVFMFKYCPCDMFLNCILINFNHF